MPRRAGSWRAVGGQHSGKSGERCRWCRRATAGGRRALPCRHRYRMFLALYPSWPRGDRAADDAQAAQNGHCTVPLYCQRRAGGQPAFPARFTHRLSPPARKKQRLLYARFLYLSLLRLRRTFGGRRFCISSTFFLFSALRSAACLLHHLSTTPGALPLAPGSHLPCGAPAFYLCTFVYTVAVGYERRRWFVTRVSLWLPTPCRTWRIRFCYHDGLRWNSSWFTFSARVSRILLSEHDAHYAGSARREETERGGALCCIPRPFCVPSSVCGTAFEPPRCRAALARRGAAAAGESANAALRRHARLPHRRAGISPAPLRLPLRHLQRLLFPLCAHRTGVRQHLLCIAVRCVRWRRCRTACSFRTLCRLHRHGEGCIRCGKAGGVCEGTHMEHFAPIATSISTGGRRDGALSLPGGFALRTVRDRKTGSGRSLPRLAYYACRPILFFMPLRATFWAHAASGRFHIYLDGGRQERTILPSVLIGAAGQAGSTRCYAFATCCRTLSRYLACFFASRNWRYSYMPVSFLYGDVGGLCVRLCAAVACHTRRAGTVSWYLPTAPLIPCWFVALIFSRHCRVLQRCSPILPTPISTFYLYPRRLRFACSTFLYLFSSFILNPSCRSRTCIISSVLYFSSRAACCSIGSVFFSPSACVIGDVATCVVTF